MIPKISIIIPVFNVENYLKQCLDSAINQTFTDIEIIVINDGSTDNSKDIIEEYEKKDSRIIFINQEHHGVGYARNLGLNIARGEYILFIDSDDWFKEETSQKLYEIVKSDEDIDLVIFQYINYDEKNDMFYEEKFDTKLNKYIDKTFTFKDIADCYLPPPCAMKFYKKSLIDDNNIRFPEETFFEDKPFHTEVILQSSKTFFTDKEFFIRRRREGSITSKADNKIFDSIRVSNLVVNAYKKYDKYQEFMKSVINNKISYLRYCYKIILNEYKQDYLKLIADDFEKIKKDKQDYDDYLSCLEGINKEFFINVDKNIDFEDLDYLLSHYKIHTQITLNPIKANSIGENALISGRLTDTDNNPLPNTQLKILTSSSQKTIKTDNNGNFKSSIKTTQSTKITLEYPGNNTYQNTTTTTDIEIKKIQTKITINPIKTTTIGEKIQINGTLTDDKNNPLPNTQLKTLINNSPKTIKTDNNGNFKLTTQINKTGTNNITIQYPGNNTYQNTSTTTKIQSMKIESKINLDPLKEVIQGDEVNFSGTLRTLNDDLISNVQIKININNSQKTIKVDEKGRFNYAYIMNKSGTNDINIIFNGNNTYLETSLSMKLDVTERKTEKKETKILLNPIKATIIGDNTPISGRLTDTDNNPLPNTQLKIFTSSSQKTIKTDNNGNFKSTIKTTQSTKITIEYPGNNTYQNTTTTTDIEIKKIQTKITINPIKTTTIGEKIQINGTLTDDKNNPLSNTQLKTLINNSPKTIKTDNNGNFKLTTQINKTGTNNITIQYPGNNTYQNTSTSTDIVIKKLQSKININPLKEVIKGEEINLNGTLTTHNDKIISNVQIKIYINNSPKTIQVNEKGKFNYAYKMNKRGTNDINIIFKGNNTYEETSLSMKLDVTERKTIKKETMITLKPIKATIIGENTPISGRLTDTDNNPLPNTQLKILTSSSQKTIKTDNNGNFTTSIKTNNKQRNIIIEYSGNNTYQKTSTSMDIEVKKLQSKINMNPLKEVIKGTEVNLSGTLTTLNDKFISNVQIKIYINNSPKTIKVDEKGRFNYAYKMNKRGTNDINIIFKGNNTYQETSLSMKVEVVDK